MSQDNRIDKLENQMNSLQKIFYKVEASLENIEKNISHAMAVKDKVIDHEARIKVAEKRGKDLEDEVKILREKIVATNMKIALAT